jgi:hypothetical protein
MKTPVKVVGFLAALAAAFGVALVTGNVIGPIGESAASSHSQDRHTTAQQSTGTAGAENLGGLMVSQNGYTFSLTDPEAFAGQNVPVTFTIDGPDGLPVTTYDVAHDKQLHLIAVRRDFHGFQHVHPTLGTDGTWAVDLDLDPGQWRLFADFAATGAEPLTLGTDLSVAGTISPSEPLPESRTAVIDGYTVTLDGDLIPGTNTMLTLNVSRNGKPVNDLQPYLAAYGHLVALRAGDLAYLHVHPDGAPDDGTTQPGPNIVFHTTIPSTGTYHLYLDFQHGGVVKTAQFTVTAPTNPTVSTPTVSDSDQSDEHDDHSGH